MDHEDFSFVSSACSYTLKDSADKDVTLNWTSENAGEYRLKIKSAGGTGNYPYSLYNICVQNRNWPIRIVVIKGGTVKFWKPDLVSEHLPQNGVYHIPKTDRISSGNPKPNANLIHYISFTDEECELLIFGGRVLDSSPMPKGLSLTSHDTIPDPPVSGSED